MKFFFKKSIFLFLTISLIILFITLMKVKFLGYNNLANNIKEEKFIKKLIEFENFKKKRDNINLVLGSSLAQSINALQLGPNWFNFSNPLQNIYNSYKFVEHQLKTIVIDSIFICIQNNDFLPMNYYENIDWGEDSQTLRLNKNFQTYEKISMRNKINNFFNNLKLTSHDLRFFINQKKEYQNMDFIYINTEKANNLDSLYLVDNQLKNRHNLYFSFVPDKIDTFWIEKFQNICDSANIKVIFISTPKSRYYHFNLKHNNYKEKNSAIKNKLKSLPIKFYDYEHLTVKINEEGFYKDETHLASKGARFFTERIILDLLSK